MTSSSIGSDSGSSQEKGSGRWAKIYRADCLVEVMYVHADRGEKSTFFFSSCTFYYFTLSFILSTSCKTLYCSKGTVNRAHCTHTCTSSTYSNKVKWKLEINKWMKYEKMPFEKCGRPSESFVRFSLLSRLHFTRRFPFSILLLHKWKKKNTEIHKKVFFYRRHTTI